MNNSFHPFWLNSPKHHPSQTKEDILTGYLQSGKFDPDEETFKLVLKHLPDTDKPILDFGCGLVRNSLKLQSLSPKKKVICYDSEAMLEAAKKEPRSQELTFVSSWEEIIETHKPDFIFASLVFQHIHPHHLRNYLSDIFNKLGKVTLFVAGRNCFDDMVTNVWPVIAEYGIITTEYHMDPSTNFNSLAPFSYNIKVYG